MSNRTKLKSYFITNAVPTAAQFAELIDSGLNPDEDSIKKLSAGPVALEAQGEATGPQEVLHFYKKFSDTDAAWKINLNGRVANAGLNISNAGTQSRLFIKESDGSIGIGTTDPKAKLQVSGGNLYVDGKVGIGVAAPNAPLSFPDSLGQKITLWGQGSVAYGFGVAPGALQIHTDTPNGDILFGYGSSTAFTERMRVKGNGNVGIGTNNPRAKLEVVGGAIIAAIGNNTNAGILFASDPAGGGGDLAWIRYQAQNYDAGGVSIKDDKSVLEIGVSNDGDDHIALMPSGNVGIGTRNPSAQLHLSGGNLFVDKGRIGINTATPFSQLSNTDKNTIGSDGNGGNPGSLAWAAAQSGYVGQFYNGGAAANAHGVVIKVASNAALALEVGQGPQEAANPSIFAVKGNGNVGVGTNNPLAKLQVTGGAIMPAAGNSSSAGIYFPENAGGGSGDAAWIRYYDRTTDGGPANTENMVLEIGIVNDGDDHIALMPSGNVGIGTINPQAKLQVAGVVMCTVVAQGSDERIKKNFTTSNLQQSLDTVNQIRVKDYLYKDDTQHGSMVQKGVIAQELETILPDAVSRHTDFVPDIYSVPQSATLSNGELSVTMPQPHRLQAGDTVRLVTAAGNKEVTIAVTSNDTFTVSNWNEAATEIFVYGKRVTDFRTVNYNTIFCLGISAIQELHKQVQQLKAEMKGLKEKLSAALVPAL